MFTRRRTTFLTAFLFAAIVLQAQDDVTYQAPPKDIMDLVLSKPTPSVSIDDKGEWMLMLERSDFPTIDELSQPELRIAGLRINPNNFSPSRSGSSTNIQIKNIKTGKVFSIQGLPQDLHASSIQWSPDGSKFAFTHTSNTEVNLYVVDMATQKAAKVNSTPLNVVLGGTFQWNGNNG